MAVDMTTPDDAPVATAEQPTAPPPPPPTQPVFGLRRGRHWPLVWVIVGVVLLALVIALIVAANRSPSPGAPGSGAAHTVAAPLTGQAQAALNVVGGVTVVTVHTADLGGDLYRISTPDGSGQVPRVTAQNGTYLLGFASVGNAGGNPSIVDIELSSHVTWSVRESGGATEARIDLRGGPVGEVDLASGVSTVELWLPGPHGDQVVRETGGATEFLVHAPSGVPVQVSVEGGAGSAVLDGVTHSGIGGGAVFTPDNWSGTTDRYDVDLVGGVSQIRVDRY